MYVVKVIAIMNPEQGDYRLEFYDLNSILPVVDDYVAVKSTRDPWGAALRRIRKFKLSVPITVHFQHQDTDHYWVEIVPPSDN